MNGHELKQTEDNYLNPSEGTVTNKSEDQVSGKNILTEEQVTDKNQQEAFNTWTRFMDIVKLNVSELKLNTWFKPIKPKSLEGTVLTISVPSQDYYEMIISRFGDIVVRAIRSILGDAGKIIYVIDPRTTFSQEPELIETPPHDNTNTTKAGTEQNTFDPNFYRPGLNQQQTSVQEADPALSQKCFLNPEYTFENFVKGKNNEFATAAAISIANKPGAQYNPLMLYGGVGLGKTHLMQAIGNHIKAANPQMKVMYLSGPDFTTNFIQSIRMNKAHEFERFYKSLDMLIVDDIQFLEGKESTQDSFFQIFNSLYQLKKQIVLSCDKPPHQLEGLE